MFKDVSDDEELKFSDYVTNPRCWDEAEEISSTKAEAERLYDIAMETRTRPKNLVIFHSAEQIKEAHEWGLQRYLFTHLIPDIRKKEGDNNA